MTLTYGQYRALLETNRRQDDRAAAYRAFHRAYADNQNTYAALYNGVLQRDWFHARARGYATTLDAALHGNNIPTSVVENLIAATKEGVEPLRRYHRLRRRVLGVDTYRLFDIFVPLVEHDARYPYDEVGEWIVDSVAPLGGDYQRQVRRAFEERWIDVFENAGKRQRRVFGAGVRRASVHAAQLQRDARRGVHAGARDGALDAHAAVARGAAVRLCGLHDLRRGGAVDAERGAVPRLDARARAVTRGARRAAAARHRQHRGHVLHAGAVCRFRAAGAPARRAGPAGHRRHARTRCTRRLLREYYGDVIDEEELSRVTWARIPHFFSTPYYVYQYATCFASTARLMQDLRAAGPARRARRSRGISRCCARAAATIR